LIDKTNDRKPVERDLRRDVELIVRFTLFSGMYDIELLNIYVYVYI